MARRFYHPALARKFAGIWRRSERLLGPSEKTDKLGLLNRILAANACARLALFCDASFKRPLRCRDFSRVLIFCGFLILSFTCAPLLLRSSISRQFSAVHRPRPPPPGTPAPQTNNHPHRPGTTHPHPYPQPTNTSQADTPDRAETAIPLPPESSPDTHVARATRPPDARSPRVSLECECTFTFSAWSRNSSASARACAARASRWSASARACFAGRLSRRRYSHPAAVCRATPQIAASARSVPG